MTSNYIPKKSSFIKLEKENEILKKKLLDKESEIEYLEDRVITLEGGKHRNETHARDAEQYLGLSKQLVADYNGSVQANAIPDWWGTRYTVPQTGDAIINTGNSYSIDWASLNATTITGWEGTTTRSTRRTSQE